MSMLKNCSPRSRTAARTTLLGGCLAAAVTLAMLPAEAFAQPAPASVQRAIKSADSSREVRAFYKARDYRPLWIRGGSIGPEADRLLHLLDTAELDGLDPGDYRPDALAEAIGRARGGSPKALARAEMLLSRRFAEYVRDSRQPHDTGMTYVDAQLTPAAPTARDALEAAAAASSLGQYLDRMGWMHPIYGELRRALVAQRANWSSARVHVPQGPILRAGATGERVRMLRLRLGMQPNGPYDDSVVSAVRSFQSAQGLPQDGLAGPRTLAALNSGSAEQQRVLYVNMQRARALPADQRGRYILVDAAAARLWLYENGRVEDTMRVVVGKSTDQTPMMAGLIRYTVVNPYWNIPPDLVQERIAPKVLSEGVSYLRSNDYQVLSDWSANAEVVDPKSVDWKAVAAGSRELRVRQLPGPDNGMGKMKFMFPNEFGVYLHDTPDKGLLRENDRRFSAGCVRVEDAPRLARWLYGKSLAARSEAPEQQVPLPEPVPVYITYLTAAPEGERIAFRPDVYNRDGTRMAGLGSGPFASR